MPLPLDGIKVLDLTRVLAGPLSTQMLGDLGAEVIKIERPGVGDDARIYGPPYLHDPKGEHSNNNSFYICANRNKHSVAVDISKKEGQDLIRELAKESDVFVENFKVDDLRRYGLDYESIRAITPRIIYCSLTGFGQTGPYRNLPGYDAIFQAAGGLMSVTGHPEGEDGAGPMKVGPSIVDVMTGLNASIGIIAALYNRDRTGGLGQHIDVCLMDTVVAAMSHLAEVYLIGREPPPRRGTSGNGGVPGRVFSCADQDIMLVAGTDGQFRNCCRAIGRPELADEPRFLTNNDRVAHRAELNVILEDILIQKPAKALLAEFWRLGVPAGPINNLEQVFSDEQVRHRGMEVTVAHPLCEELPLIRNAILFSETPVTRYRTPPLLGQDTRQVLRDRLGYSDERIAALCRDGVVQTAK